MDTVFVLLFLSELSTMSQRSSASQPHIGTCHNPALLADDGFTVWTDIGAVHLLGIPALHLTAQAE